MSESESHRKNMVRDFIYVDVDRLNSIYSQVFEGVAPMVVESIIDRIRDTSTEKPKRRASFEEEVAAASQITKSRYLYDYMYTKLEEKLSSSIVEPKPFSEDIDIDPDEGLGLLGHLVKVSGYPQLQDYALVESFMLNWDSFVKLFEADFRGKFENELQSLKDEISKETDRNEKARLKARLKSHEEKYEERLKSHLEKHDMLVDKDTLDGVRTLTKMYYDEGLSLSVARPADPLGFIFRVPLHREWLRVNANRLRRLYGGSAVGSEWTVVGLVTRDSLAIKGVIEALNKRRFTVKSSTMQDDLREMFYGVTEGERMLMQSGDSIEVHIDPLVIYRELKIDLGD